MSVKVRRFQRMGTPGLHATWLRPALFASALTSNLDDPRYRRRAVSVGAQFDIRFTVLSNQDMTLSFGAAVARRNGERSQGEAMISLKVLR